MTDLKNISLTCCLFFIGLHAFGQHGSLNAIDYTIPRTYEIGGITVSGTDKDANTIKLFAGLNIGDKIEIPGERLPRAIRNLWDQKLFSDVQIEAPEVRGNTIFLVIKVQEQPSFAYRTFTGDVSRSDQEKIAELYTVRRGEQVNDGVVMRMRNSAYDYLKSKGYLKGYVEVQRVKPDTAFFKGDANSVGLNVHVVKGPKVRIKDINFTGNEHMTAKSLRKVMRGTKRKRFYTLFKGSKFIEGDFRADKNAIVQLYNAQGYRNAEVLSDSMYFVSDNKIAIDLAIQEDAQFRFRNIRFTGNTKHDDEALERILQFKKGDVYNKSLLDERLFQNQTGLDVSSLYLDDGYLGFFPEAIESLVPGDSIDLEIRMNEGRQYRVRNVLIRGNTKTHDHVIRREIRTKPGDLFSRTDILRTQQELAALGYFNPQTLGVNPIQDQRTGTVDLEYTVEEQPSDRLELSGGFGAGRLVLTLGLSFTNFSVRNLFNPEAWRPLPAGDGQTLSLRAQTNGAFFQSYSLSFIEPWLGGRKPNSLSTSFFYTNQTNGIFNSEDPNRQRLGIIGATIGLGKRLQWPDDRFILRATLGYQRYELNNWQQLFSFTEGVSNVVTGEVQFQRNGLDYRKGGVFFPTGGAVINLSVKATLPYSNWFYPNRNFGELSDAERFELIEFHKWKFTTQWYTPLDKNQNFVLALRGGLGFLGNYNDQLGNSPFERFYLGGSALTGFQLDGREIVGLRGYDDLSLAPDAGNFLITKYTAELRYLISPNPSAQIYGTTFLEAGNTYADFDTFDPFQLFRSAGLGLRLNLPAFGPLGLDYGWRLDDVPTRPSTPRSQFHFTIGIDLGEL